jgi:hypothetical protein
VNVSLSFGIIIAVLAGCLVLVSWMIRTGWRLRH